MKFVSLFTLLFLSLVALFQSPIKENYQLSSNERIELRLPASGTCTDLVSSFIEASGPRLKILNGSLFAQYPDLYPKVNQLTFSPIEFNLFYRDFYKQHNRVPTLRDGMEHVYATKRNVLARYDDLINDLKSLQDPKLKNFENELIFSRRKLDKFKDLDQFDSEIKNAHQNGKTQIESLDEKIQLKDGELFEDRHFLYLKERTGQSNFAGEVGELMAYGTTQERVLSRGLTFSSQQNLTPDSYQTIIAGAVANLKKELESKNELQLIAFVKAHGDGLLRQAQEYIDDPINIHLDLDVIVERIMGMIKSKEIDLVAQRSDGKVIWAEVKAYKRAITPETLNGDGHSKKTMLDQLVEHKALRDVLGFKDKVIMRYIAPTSEVTPEARKMIEGIGYEVIGAE